MAHRRSTQGSSKRSSALPTNKNLVIGSLILVAVVVALGFLIASPLAAVPTKPGSSMTSTSNATKETWYPANGLSEQVTQVAFAGARPEGYAAVFDDKRTQSIFKTKDAGASWQKINTLTYPIADILTINPTDPQDVVMVSSEIPAAGNYSIERSYDGGITWQAQSMTLSSSATVSQAGWSDATFLLGISLDRVPIGDSALIAFPPKLTSSRLDTDGKINGHPLSNIQLITGHGNTLNIWGIDESNGNRIGWISADQGKSWSSSSYSSAGATVFPIAATADGQTFLATTADRSQLSFSKDAGRSWNRHPSFDQDKVFLNKKPLLAPNGEPFIHVDSDKGAGTYTVQNNRWVKITDEDILALSCDTKGHPTKIWSYDAHGQLMWRHFS